MSPLGHAHLQFQLRSILWQGCLGQMARTRATKQSARTAVRATTTDRVTIKLNCAFILVLVPQGRLIGKSRRCGSNVIMSAGLVLSFRKSRIEFRAN